MIVGSAAIYANDSVDVVDGDGVVVDTIDDALDDIVDDAIVVVVVIDDDDKDDASGCDDIVDDVIVVVVVVDKDDASGCDDIADVTDYDDTGVDYVDDDTVLRQLVPLDDQPYGSTWNNLNPCNYYRKMFN